MRLPSLFQNMILLAALHAAPAAPASKPLTGTPGAAQWEEDIDILQRSFEQLHPGLYLYSSPEQIRDRFDAVRALARSGADFNRMYLALSELAGSLRCGHTYTNFGNQQEATKDRLYRHPAHLPFHFLWLDGRMVVTDNFSGNPALIAGSEIVSINGVPASRILSALMPIARADGHNDAKRIDYLQVQGLNEYEAFDVYLPLYFPEIGSEQMLEVRLPGERELRRIPVQGHTYAQRKARLRAAGVPSGDAAPDWTLSFPVPDTAVLRMSTWALYNTRWDWRAYLDGMFATLKHKQTRRLVIDLRQNEGGLSEIGDYIVAHLIEAPLILPAVQRQVAYRKVPDPLVPYLDTWDRGFLDWGEQAIADGPRRYRLERPSHGGMQEILPAAGARFSGEVFILTSATNSSAAFQFVQRARQAGVARLIGMPTGGNQRGINGGAFFFLTLPNSRIEFDLPLIGQYPVASMPDAGIEPDVLVQTSAEDIAAGRDPVLATALSFVP